MKLGNIQQPFPKIKVVMSWNKHQMTNYSMFDHLWTFWVILYITGIMIIMFHYSLLLCYFIYYISQLCLCCGLEAAPTDPSLIPVKTRWCGHLSRLFFAMWRSSCSFHGSIDRLCTIKRLDFLHFNQDKSLRDSLKHTLTSRQLTQCKYIVNIVWYPALLLVTTKDST